jgi:hypothetical protein
MNLIVERADVWAAPIDDSPGGMLGALEPLKEAGADLDLIIGRRSPESPGKGVVFVTPLRRDKEIAAAAAAGFNVAKSIHSVRIQGHNQAGLAAEIGACLADAGINLKGFSAAELGTRFVLYLGLDSEADAEKAVRVLQEQWTPAQTDLHQSAA